MKQWCDADAADVSLYRTSFIARLDLCSCVVCLLVLLANWLTCPSVLQVEEFEAEIAALQNTKRKAKPPP